MTADELAIFQAATQIYISRETRLHGRKDSDLRFEVAEKARLRWQAADEARALYKHVVDLGISDTKLPMNVAFAAHDTTYLDALNRHNGNVREAAHELKVCDKTIYRWLKDMAPDYFRLRRQAKYDARHQNVQIRIRVKEEV